MSRTPPSLGEHSDEERTPEKRTYDTPGECPKCGSMTHRIEWDNNRDIERTLEDPSHRLYAVCKACTFWWTISAKDEQQ